MGQNFPLTLNRDKYNKLTVKQLPISVLFFYLFYCQFPLNIHFINLFLVNYKP
jgi:hypothetical protein